MSVNNNALSSSTSSSSQVLPPREASLFKKILKHFKDKQFKNGLKICNQILSNPKFSEHGETLSMKGLILNSMGKKQEALDYVRRGLKNDVKSHVCWHVFGLLQKADHKYEEAIKCYRNALRLKKDSVQILSDLSLVQIQTRDLEGYRDSRYQLFLLRPGERSTWIGCAMAYHLAGDHMTAVNILSEYQKSSQTGNNLRNNNQNNNRNSNNRRQNNEIYEHSELLLYHVFILLECNRYEEALQLLDENENNIVDKVSYYEYKVEIYLALNRFLEAEQILLNQLIDRNPENVEYFNLLEKSKQISLEDELKRLEMYEEMLKLYPRSLTITRLPLTFIKNLNLFEIKMDLYLKQGFRKGRPALFRDLKSLYNFELKDLFTSFTCKKLDINNNIINNNDNNSANNNINHNNNNLNHQQAKIAMLSKQELNEMIKNQRLIKLTKKIEIIEQLLLNYCENLQQKNTFDFESKEEESATCLLWVYYFLAQHFDALKEFSLALYFANQALIHTPTLIDIFVIKAKIFKHSGLLDKAVKCLDEAQSLDTSDRYLNSKCAKYLIRVNRIKEAEDMCLKFTREGVSAAENLNEMQCMWYQNEVAKAYKRMGMFGSALMKCIQIDNHFAEIQEDQFDFNTYCILKVTLRAYVKMIRLEDRIKSHRFFITAAKTAIEIYLRLYDCPVNDKSEQDNENKSNLSASELRKIRNKQRKALLKATAEKENDKSQKNKSQSKKDSESKIDEQEFIDPIKLEKTEEPLQDVQRFLQPVKIFGKKLEEIHMLAFEVYYRKGKLLLQLQCLKRAFNCLKQTETENNNFNNSKYYPSLLRQTLLFLNYLITKKSNLNETIRLVLIEELKSMPCFQKHLLKNGDINANTNDNNANTDIISRLPTIDEFFQNYLPMDSQSFLIRVENIHAKFLLTKFNNENLNQNNQILTNNNDANCNSSSSNDVQQEQQQKSSSTPTPQASEEIQNSLKKLIEDLNLSLIKQHLSLENCSEFFQKIQSNYFGKISEQLIEELREKLHQLYPFAQCFMNDKQLNEMELELSLNDYFTNEPEEFNNCNNNTIEDN